MKLEKNDRIISNADYEKLVGLAELHYMAIDEVVSEAIHLKVFEVQAMVNKVENTHRGLMKINDTLIEIANESHIRNSEWSNLYDNAVALKNRIIQEKNAEIARLKKRWWNIF